MAKSSIGQAFKDNEIALEAFGDSKDNYLYASSARGTTAIENSLEYLGMLYTKKLNDILVARKIDSSGKLAESIKPSEVQKNGSVFSITISANEYASYVDEGVNGWAQDRGSKFQFKTKGVNPDGEMVKSIKKYLTSEKKMSTVPLQPVNNRERKRASIRDATTSRAISAAYMIKRMGIKPTHFWRDATADMTALIAEEFAAALKIDIINALTGQKY